MTRPYVEVIGDPIAHSKSPLIHNFWLAKLGIDAEYRACHVRADELADYFARRRGDAMWRGCNITIPHKEVALAFVDHIGPDALQVGATNCVIASDGRLEAQNTDIAGVDEALPGVHSSVCIIGCGGAARAAIPSLDVMCAIDVRVVARDQSKAAAMLSDFDLEPQVFAFDQAESAMHGAEGVINASPLGMVGQCPMPQSIFAGLKSTTEDAYVFDMVYNPLETELLKAGRGLNREAIDGLVMLVGQARTAFKQFFGVPAPREYDIELRSLLTA